MELRWESLRKDSGQAGMTSYAALFFLTSTLINILPYNLHRLFNSP